MRKHANFARTKLPDALDITSLHIPSVSSTNDLAANWVKSAAPGNGLQVTTDEQTAGRGQRGNHWHHAPGEDLAWSLALKWPQDGKPKPWTPIQLNFIVAVAVRNVIEAVLKDKFPVAIKWPNDLLLGVDSLSTEDSIGQRWEKCAGLLIENTWKGSQWDAIVIGIGLNVNSDRTATPGRASLKDRVDRSFDLTALASAFQSEVLDALLQWAPETATEAYHQHLIGRGDWKSYTLRSEVGLGNVSGVDSTGALEMRWKGGQTDTESRLRIESSADLTWDWLEPPIQ